LEDGKDRGEDGILHFGKGIREICFSGSITLIWLALRLCFEKLLAKQCAPFDVWSTIENGTALSSIISFLLLRSGSRLLVNHSRTSLVLTSQLLSIDPLLITVWCPFG